MAAGLLKYLTGSRVVPSLNQNIVNASGSSHGKLVSTGYWNGMCFAGCGTVGASFKSDRDLGLSSSPYNYLNIFCTFTYSWGAGCRTDNGIAFIVNLPGYYLNDSYNPSYRRLVKKVYYTSTAHSAITETFKVSYPISYWPYYVYGDDRGATIQAVGFCNIASGHTDCGYEEYKNVSISVGDYGAFVGANIHSSVNPAVTAGNQINKSLLNNMGYTNSQIQEFISSCQLSGNNLSYQMLNADWDAWYEMGNQQFTPIIASNWNTFWNRFR